MSLVSLSHDFSCRFVFGTHPEPNVSATQRFPINKFNQYFPWRSNLPGEWEAMSSTPSETGTFFLFCLFFSFLERLPKGSVCLCALVLNEREKNDCNRTIEKSEITSYENFS